jgi:LysR family transcriptional activator of nhaA
MIPLNYHHLQYFRAVAHEGNLTRTARKLRIAQSALSSQIQLLEEQLGQALFSREGRRLTLTEAGEIALSYADTIVDLAGELVSTLQEGRRRPHVLRVGAVATLSRNFQRSFLHPVLQQPDVRLQLTSGSLEELLGKLRDHTLDLVLSNQPPPPPFVEGFQTRRLASQPVSLVCSRAPANFRFPQGLSDLPMIVPGASSEMRRTFDALCSTLDIRMRILAEVDDMAILRLLARDTDALVLVPSVVVREELRQGIVHEWCIVPDLFETFYAISAERRYPHPLLHALLHRDEASLLAGPGAASAPPDGILPASSGGTP